MQTQFLIQFETKTGEQFFATCTDIGACVTRAFEQWPNDGLKVTRMEALPQ